MLLLEATPNLHWHATAVVGGAAGGWAVAPARAVLVIDDPEGRSGGPAGAAGRGAVAAEAIGSAEGQLVLAAELGEGLGQHGDLVGVAVAQEVLVPLTPHLRFELL